MPAAAMGSSSSKPKRRADRTTLQSASIRRASRKGHLAPLVEGCDEDRTGRVRTALHVVRHCSGACAAFGAKGMPVTQLMITHPRQQMLTPSTRTSQRIHLNQYPLRRSSEA